MTINNRGISAEIHQWEDSDRVTVKTSNDGSGNKMIRIEVWTPYYPEDLKRGLNMTHFTVAFREETALCILKELARMYPTACAEALGYEEAPECDVSVED